MFMWYASVVLILSLQCSSECYGQNEDLTALKFEDSDLVVEHDTWPEVSFIEGYRNKDIIILCIYFNCMKY